MSDNEYINILLEEKRAIHKHLTLCINTLRTLRDECNLDVEIYDIINEALEYKSK